MAGKDERTRRITEFQAIEKKAYKSYRDELDDRLEDLYPRISRVEQCAQLSRVGNEDLVFASLDFSKAGPDLVTEFLKAAVTRAVGDSEDRAYCLHAYNEHDTFEEAANRVFRAISKQEVFLRLVDLRTKDGGWFERLVVETQPFFRRVRRPRAYQDFLSFSQGQAKTTNGSVEDLRRAITTEIKRKTKEKGLAYGLLLATYYGLSIDNIFKLFEDANLRKSLESRGIGWMTRKRQTDVELLSKLQTTLMVDRGEGVLLPRYGPYIYHKALELLSLNGLVPPVNKAEEDERYRLVEFGEEFSGVMVLSGLSHDGQAIAAGASMELPKAGRDIVVWHVCKGVVTSRVITLFMKTENLMLNWNGRVVNGKIAWSQIQR